jgi:hypothetical protein
VISSRKLLREEIEQVWNIDRSEMIDNLYRFENGILVLRPHHIDVLGWPPGEAEKSTPILLDCFDRADGSMARSRAQNWSDSSSWRTSLSASKKINSSLSPFT